MSGKQPRAAGVIRWVVLGSALHTFQLGQIVVPIRVTDLAFWVPSLADGRGTWIKMVNNAMNLLSHIIISTNLCISHFHLWLCNKIDKIDSDR